MRNMIIHRFYRIAFSAGIAFVFAPSAVDASVWKQFDLNPRVSLRESYDDNVTSANDNTIDDWVTELVLGFGFDKEGKHHLFSWEANITQQVFLDNHSFNNTALDLQADYSKAFSRNDEFYLNEDFSHSEDPRSFDDAFGRDSGRFSTNRNDFTAGYTRELNEQLSWDAHYQNQIADFSTGSRSDSVLHAFAIGSQYAFSSVTDLDFDYEYRHRAFDPGASADIHELSATVRRYLTRLLYVDLTTGLDFIHDFIGDDYVRPLYKIALTQDVDENTQASVSFEQSYKTIDYTQDILDAWRISAKLGRDLSARVRAYFTGFLGQGEYAQTNREEKLKGAGLGLAYELTERTKLNFGYHYTDSDPTTSTNGYTKSVITLGVELEF